MKTANRTARVFAGSLACLTVALALLSQIGFAQTASTTLPDTLNFFKNYMVTGDHVVGGVGLAGTGDGTGFATGTIQIPANPQTATSTGGVPPNADIVAAFLYWQTVESTSTPSSMNGFFGSGSNIYPITGKAIGNATPPCWSSGGATGSSQGTIVLRVYRADVRMYLPIVNGRAQGNGSFTVRLPDSGKNGNVTPITEGASLLIVYRLLSASAPLRSVVLYDGAWTMNTSNPFMSQHLQGFYDAWKPAGATNTAKITHIVGNGQSNFTEQLTFNGNVLANNPFIAALGPNWDNPTYDVTPYINDDDSIALTQVLPISNSFDCLTWGTVVFSTLVKNTDNDALLNVWKNPPANPNNPPGPGYRDIADGSWVPLPGAVLGEKDIFVQMDYMCSVVNSDGTCSTTGHSHLPFEAALRSMGDMFLANGYHLHVAIGNHYQNDPYVIPSSAGAGGGNVVPEANIACNDANVTPPKVCEFPGVPALGWKGGFDFIRNQNFQHGRKDSYHYMLFGHLLGEPTTSWSINAGTLTSIVNNGTTATVTTSAPHGLSTGARVSVSGALAALGLNGTYVITVPSVSSPNTFTFTTANIPNGTYNNPGLAIATGPARTISGWSDFGGRESGIFLGGWRSDDSQGCQPNPEGPLSTGQTYCSDQIGGAQQQLGTIVHEFGHTLGLPHGGVYPDGSGGVVYGLNCKPNYLSPMNYLFQIRGQIGFDGLIHNGLIHNGYSNGVLPSLLESSLFEANGLGQNLPSQTRWYAPAGNNFIEKQLQTVGTRAATRHCDGSPLSASDTTPMTRVDGPSAPGAIDWNNNGSIDSSPVSVDINFNGTQADSTFADFNDWANIDLRQIGAGRNAFGFSADVNSGDLLGTGGDLLGSGGDLLGTGGDLLGTGGDLLGTGGDLLGTGGEDLNDFDLANSTVDPPSGLVAAAVNKAVQVNWQAPGFGRIRVYYIWRADITKVPMSASNPPVNIGKVTGSPPATMFTDTTAKNSTTYLYFVSAQLGADSGANSGNESGPSNMFTLVVKF